MLKKTFAFGLLAASTIGFSIPAHAQNAVVGSQVIDSTTVGVNGSNVYSDNEQTLHQDLFDSGYFNYGGTGEPNIVTGQQAIDSTTVGVNGSNVYSDNEQTLNQTLSNSDDSPWYPYYSQPYYGAY